MSKKHNVRDFIDWGEERCVSFESCLSDCCDDLKSDEGSEFLPYDPFGMGDMDSDATLPVDPFGMDDMDLVATLPVDPFEMDEISASNGLNISRDDVFMELFIRMRREKKGLETADSITSTDFMEELMGFNSEDSFSTSDFMEVCDDILSPIAEDVLLLLLKHIKFDVKDLLSIEMVCKSLRDVVRSDVFLWKDILIEHPLNYKIHNDDLLRLTDRARGGLLSLGISGSFHITNDGLRRVLDRNLQLTKLSVAGAMRLSFEGLLNDLKAFKSVAKPGIKHLRIGEIRISGPGNITNVQMRELMHLLEADGDAIYKPRYLTGGKRYLGLDDERAIDIEPCPKCQYLKQVYDCPTEKCKVKTCRACFLCIARCMQCGCCLDDKVYQEEFNLDLFCSDCGHPRATYHVFVYG